MMVTDSKLGYYMSLYLEFPYWRMFFRRSYLIICSSARRFLFKSLNNAYYLLQTSLILSNSSVFLLPGVCRTYSAQRAIRVKRVVDRKKM